MDLISQIEVKSQRCKFADLNFSLEMPKTDQQYLFNSTGKIFASLIRLTCSMRRDNNKRNLKRQKRGRNWNYCNRS